MDEVVGAKPLTLDIDYLDWDGKGWTAWRTGDGSAPFVSDSIKYKDATGANRTAKLGPGAAPTETVNLPVNIGPRITFTPVTPTTPTFAAAPPDVTVGSTTVTCIARSILGSTATISFTVTVTGVQLFPPDD